MALKVIRRSDVFVVDAHTDVIFSESDEKEKGSGWYLQRYDGRTSMCSSLFATKEEALRAYKEGEIDWLEDGVASKLASRADADNKEALDDFGFQGSN